MNCEEAENLICARIDGELPADDPGSVALDAHLAGCAACRTLAEATAVQDAALVRAFAAGRRSADGVAERAVVAFAGLKLSPRPRYWPIGFAAVAAGVVLVMIALGPLLRTRTVKPEVVATTPPVEPIAPETQPAVAHVAEVALFTGEVFSCPSGKTDEWQPVVAGASLATGDRVRTSPTARVELVMADGSQVRLNGQSEALLSADRCVQLVQGQLWSAVPREASPLCVVAPPAESGKGVIVVTEPGGRVDLRCEPSESILTAVQGSAKVTDTRGQETQVPTGSAVTLVNGLPSGKSTPGDVLLATKWLNDLLVLKGRDDPELTARVNELLLRINAESASATKTTSAPAAPGPVEQSIRAQGDRWFESFACHVQSPASQSDPATRVTAARLLADLAPPSAIADLIALLPDRDGQVRFYAATALRRLTGQDLGRSPAQCATDSAEAVDQTHKNWQAWWEQHNAPRRMKARAGT